MIHSRQQGLRPALFAGDPAQLQMLRRADAQQGVVGRDARTPPDADEYSGLMTQREKDWVVKIQLLQLHTDNPYVDDYYYTVSWYLVDVYNIRRPYNLYCVGGDVKPCSIQSIN